MHSAFGVGWLVSGSGAPQPAATRDATRAAATGRIVLRLRPSGGAVSNRVNGYGADDGDPGADRAPQGPADLRTTSAPPPERDRDLLDAELLGVRAQEHLDGEAIA